MYKYGVPERPEWTVGRQLKRWRLLAKLRAADVADAIGVSQQTVSNWEVDGTRPHISKAHKLEDLYGLEPGVVTAILSGAVPPPDAIDPELVGIRDGHPIWSARFFLDEDAMQEWYGEYDYDSEVEAAIARDSTISDDDKQMLNHAYRTAKQARAARPSPHPEPEGP